MRRRKGGGGGRRTEVLEDYNINVEFVFMHVFKLVKSSQIRDERKDILQIIIA